MQESQAKLGPLHDILESLNKSSHRPFHPKSHSLNGLQTDTLSPMTRSLSMPRDSDYRKFRGTTNKTKTNFTVYKDAALSSAQDYVSGCSLITHTPLKSKASNANRTKGRAAEHKFRFWSSNRAGKPSQDAGLSVDQSNFIRSSSFHGRSSRDERMNNLSMFRSFDSGGKPKNIPLVKPDLRLKALSDPPDLVSSKSNVQNLRLSADDISSKRSNQNFAPTAKSISSSMLSDAAMDGDKTIRRLPDIIHESVMWNDLTHQPDQPLYFSPATEPMTPLGNRNFKFGFGFPDDVKGFDDDEDSRRRGSTKPYTNPEIALNHDPSTANHSISLQVSDPQHPAMPISYNTWSSKSSDSDSLNRSGNYGSSLQELNSKGTNSVQHSSNASLHIDQSTPPSAPVTIIYSNEDDLEDTIQKPHSLSIISGYSSICSDQERGSVCSLETCSCTSSEDPESTGHHNHHNRVGSTKLRRGVQQPT